MTISFNVKGYSGFTEPQYHALQFLLNQLQEEDQLGGESAALPAALVTAPDIPAGEDITAALNAFLPTVPAGATVVFPPNRDYIVSGGGIFADIAPGISFNFNGTLLTPSAGFFHVANKAVFRVRVAGTVHNVTSTISRDQVTYTLPAGISATSGDLITFTTSTLITGAFAERYDWTCRVVSAAGQVVLLDTGAPNNCDITKIRITSMQGKRAPSTFQGLRVSLAACPTRTDQVPFQVWGMLLQNFDHPVVDACDITGAESACVAVQFDNCISPTFRNGSVSRFYCLPNFQVTGKLGYGVNFYNCSQGTVTNSDLFACRHQVAAGGFMAGNLVVDHNRIVDDPDFSTQLGAVNGVQVDQHEGCIGQLVVMNNTQVVSFAGAYARGQHLRYRNNLVRFIHPQAFGVALANERSIESVLIIDNEFSGAAAGNRILSTPSTDVASIDILRNRMDGGSLMIPGPNIPATVTIGSLRICDNILKSANRLFECQVASVTGKLKKLEISGNSVTLNADSTSAVRISGTVANTPIGNLTISNNNFDISASLTAYFLRLTSLHADSFTLSGNNFKGAGGVHNMGLGVELNGIGVVSQMLIDGNSIDTDCWMYSGATHTLPRLQLTNNSITRFIFEESNAASPWGIGQWDISNNKFGAPVWAGAGLIFRASSATFWASTVSSIHVIGNQVQTSGGTAIDINSGHVGNRFIFKNNFLNAAVIMDATSTYHSTDGNYTSGNQLGKGGTVARTDGLYSTAAPASGTWVPGNKIYNSAPANSAGSPTGWVNVAAGSPGTWRGFGVTL